MDYLRIVYWFCLGLLWICLIANWWLIFRNHRTRKRLEKLEGLYETAIRELDGIRDRYLERLYEMRTEVSDEGNNND